MPAIGPGEPEGNGQARASHISRPLPGTAPCTGLRTMPFPRIRSGPSLPPALRHLLFPVMAQVVGLNGAGSPTKRCRFPDQAAQVPLLSGTSSILPGGPATTERTERPICGAGSGPKIEPVPDMPVPAPLRQGTGTNHAHNLRRSSISPLLRPPPTGMRCS